MLLDRPPLRRLPGEGPTARPARWLRVLGWCAIGLALALVFAAYLHPSMAFEVAQQLWSCF